MKKLFLTILAAFTMLTANAQEDVFRLSGKLNETGDTVIMYVVDISKRSLVDTQSVVVCENAFETTLDIKEPAMLILYNKTGEAISQISVQVFAMPKEHCVITGTWENYKLDGSKFYKEYNDLTGLTESVQKEANDLVEECQGKIEAGEDQEAVAEYYHKKAVDITKRVNQIQTDYIKAHTDSEVAAVLFMSLEPETAIEMYSLLSDNVKNGRMKPLLDSLMEQAKKEHERKEQAKNIEEGKPAPDFVLNDINGNPLALSSLRGKYVILDFWGSWCGWCIKGMPQMKEYYAKYSDKLEILGIDCGDSDEAWKEAVKKHELPWKHVYNTEDSNVTTIYAIQGYPTKIVIDPQGNIAKVIVGEDPEFYTYLDELFK